MACFKRIQRHVSKEPPRLLLIYDNSVDNLTTVIPCVCLRDTHATCTHCAKCSQNCGLFPKPRTELGHANWTFSGIRQRIRGRVQAHFGFPWLSQMLVVRDQTSVFVPSADIYGQYTSRSSQESYIWSIHFAPTRISGGRDLPRDF